MSMLCQCGMYVASDSSGGAILSLLCRDTQISLPLRQGVDSRIMDAKRLPAPRPPI
jgi:hypothetical protein